MARILAIDYGTKRTGLAVTDPLQIIANGLDTLPTEQVIEFLKKYTAAEEVETIVVGEPMHLDGNPAQIAPQVQNFVRQVRELFPGIKVVMQDERFTSEDAKKIILQSGAKKKKRQDKALVDKISAVLILQEYLEKTRYQQ
ncbi:MAG: Holliday junction resolvase RuvX [Saprospiraceae bacterium]